MSILGLVIVGVVVVAAYVAYKLWKSGKAVTGAAVVAGVKTDVVAAADAVKAEVVKDVTKS